MGVYAHPDDESTCAGGVIALHAERGVRVVLVTCTGGEFGDGPGGVKPGSPGHDPAAVAEIRRAELDAACEVLGVAVVERLGYHDSGMPGWDRFAREPVFSQVPVDSVSARIAALLDRYRPDVVITHNPDASHEHADHRHAARAAALAVEISHFPVNLYFSAHGARHWQHLRNALNLAGFRHPDADAQRIRVLTEIESRITHRIGISDLVQRKRAALRCHESQLGSSLAARLSPAQYASVFRSEAFIRASGGSRGHELFMS